jgi:hypothetical protein
MSDIMILVVTVHPFPESVVLVTVKLESLVVAPS